MYKCSAWRFPKEMGEQVGLLIDLERDEEQALVKVGFVCEARGNAVDPGEWFKAWVQTFVGKTEFANDYKVEHVDHQTIMNALPKVPVQTRRVKSGKLE